MRISGREGGGAGGRWEDFLRAFKRVCGMPDYAGYLRHMAERHPGTPVLNERDFFEAHVTARYANGASRCC
jgi:uncharacterized short protein YbdD (DUF466 family)